MLMIIAQKQQMLLEVVANATRQESEIYWKGGKKIANDMTTLPNCSQKTISKIHKQNGQI